MAVPILTELQEEYVKSLLDEGIINERFCCLPTLKIAEQPEHIVQSISSYFADTEAILSKLTKSTDTPDISLEILVERAREIGEKSLRIGAEHMRRACWNLIRACDQKDVQKISQAQKCLHIEFSRTRNKLDAVVQMEKRILKLLNKQKK